MSWSLLIQPICPQRFPLAKGSSLRYPEGSSLRENAGVRLRLPPKLRAPSHQFEMASMVEKFKYERNFGNVAHLSQICTLHLSTVRFSFFFIYVLWT